MSRSAARARAGQDRTSLYQEITDKIIAELEAGRVPWAQPWGTAAVKAPLAMPKNAATERRYSGINVLILWGAVIERGFTGQSWLTFRQALSLGGHVRKGEKGITVVYADRFTPEDERQRAEEAGEAPAAIPLMQLEEERVIAGAEVDWNHVVILPLGSRLVAEEDGAAVHGSADTVRRS